MFAIFTRKDNGKKVILRVEAILECQEEDGGTVLLIKSLYSEQIAAHCMLDDIEAVFKKINSTQSRKPKAPKKATTNSSGKAA